MTPSSSSDSLFASRWSLLAPLGSSAGASSSCAASGSRDFDAQTAAAARPDADAPRVLGKRRKQRSSTLDGDAAEPLVSLRGVVAGRQLESLRALGLLRHCSFWPCIGQAAVANRDRYFNSRGLAELLASSLSPRGHSARCVTSKTARGQRYASSTRSRTRRLRARCRSWWVRCTHQGRCAPCPTRWTPTSLARGKLRATPAALSTTLCASSRAASATST